MPSSEWGDADLPPVSTAKVSRLKSLGSWFLLLLILILVGTAFAVYRDTLLESLISTETHLRQIQISYPVLVVVVGLLVYILVSGLTPGAAFLSLAYGWYFGLWQGTLVVSFGSTAGATLMLCLSRYILRDRVLAMKHPQIEKVQAAFAREGAYYLFSLRLIPAVPFFLVNIVMGLTQIRLRTFWWVSQLGMLPGTIAYIYAGSTLPSLKALGSGDLGQILSWQMALAFTILGLLPWLTKRVLACLSRSES